MLTRAMPWLITLGVALLSIGCRPPDPSTPVEGHRELCCKTASPDNVSFAGCRASRVCRTNEPIWVRGPIRCGAADPRACAGGRCCELDLEALSIHDSIAAPAPAQTEAERQAPAPDRIHPIPLDWRATPVLVAVPKFVCPNQREGSVSLRVRVGAKGEVLDVQVSRGFDPECDALAREALIHAQFEPARSPNGEPIPATLTWSYRFGGG